MEGTVVAQSDIGDRTEGQRLRLRSAINRTGAFTATVEHEPNAEDTHSYRAGPYRTKLRSQVAAEGIAGRIEGEKDVSRYHTGSHSEPIPRRRY